MSVIEQHLIAAIRTLDEHQQQQVLSYVQQLQAPRRLSARELLQLPPDERARHVAAAFALAADMEFETFEAYSEEPLDE